MRVMLETGKCEVNYCHALASIQDVIVPSDEESKPLEEEIYPIKKRLSRWPNKTRANDSGSIVFEEHTRRVECFALFRCEGPQRAFWFHIEQLRACLKSRMRSDDEPPLMLAPVCSFDICK